MGRLTDGGNPTIVATRMFRPASLLLAVVAALPAQTKTPTARQFLLDDYTTVVHVDMKAIRESGVWEEMAASVLKALFATAEGEFGFAMDRLDRLTLVQRPRRDSDEMPRIDEVVTVEGNGDLGTMAAVGRGRYTEQTVGDFVLLRDQWDEETAVVQVTPALRVHGTPHLLEEVLAGKPRTGLPSPDVMAFTVGRKNLLLYAIAHLPTAREAQRMVENALPGAWPQGDKPTFVCLRALATGDTDDPHVTLELVLRHGTAGDGLVASDKAIADALAQLAKIPQARMVWPLLKKVERERDGSDAVYRVDLGRARHVGGMLTTLAPMLLFASADVQAVGGMQGGQVLVEEVVVEEPAPAPEKKKEEKKQ